MLPTRRSDCRRFVVATPALILALTASSHAIAVPAERSGSLAVAAQDMAFTLLGHAGGPVRAVAVLNRHVLVGAGPQLLVFDVLVPGRPQLVSDSLALPGQVEGVAVDGAYAYVVAGKAGLFIYDVSAPSQPVLLGSLPTPGAALRVAVSGRYAYIAAQSSGLRIIDAGEVSQPVEVGFYDNPAFDILDVALDGAFAYVACGRSGLQVLNVSDPTEPVAVGSLALPGVAQGVAISAGHAYVAAGRSGLLVVDISNPQQPLQVGASRKDAEDAHAVTVAGDHAYVADRAVWTGEVALPGGLRTVDVSSPDDPISVANLVGDVWAVAVADDHAYIASYDTLSGHANSFDVVRVEDPSQPLRLAVFAVPAGMSASMVASGGSLYLHDQGLSRIDATNPRQPHLVWNLQLPADSFGQLPGLAISGRYAYVGAGRTGMHVVDLQDPKRPQLVATLASEAFEVAVQGSLAFISNLFGGLSLVDVSDPTDPNVVAAIPGSWSVRDMQAVGDHLYIGTYGFPAASALLIYDIADPLSPVLVGSLEIGFDPASHVEVSGRYAYLGTGAALGGVLIVVDVANPARPKAVGRLGFPVYFYDMALAGDHVLVTLPSIPGGGLRSIDVSNPVQPRVDGQYVLQSTFATSVAVLPGRMVALGSTPLSGSDGLGLDVLQATKTPR